MSYIADGHGRASIEAIEKCRQLLFKIRDVLRTETIIWGHQVAHNRAMELSLLKKMERNVERSKILQKVRLKHVERLLDYLESGNPYKTDIHDEIRDYWKTILPDIRETLKEFREVDDTKLLHPRLHELMVPDCLELYSIQETSNRASSPYIGSENHSHGKASSYTVNSSYDRSSSQSKSQPSSSHSVKTMQTRVKPNRTRSGSKSLRDRR